VTCFTLLFWYFPLNLGRLGEIWIMVANIHHILELAAFSIPVWKVFVHKHY
jgi:hypothetical protein